MATDSLLLAEQHRAAQDHLSDLLGGQVVSSFRGVMSSSERDDLAQQWLDAMARLIQGYNRRSAGVSAVFYRQIRAAEAPGAAAYQAARADDLAREAVETSLRVTGLIGLTEKLARGMGFDQALEEAAEAAAGAAQRHALNGGRSFTRNTVMADTLAQGFYRQAKDGCCYFCAMLASRGPVFKEDSFAASDPRFMDDPDDPSTEKVHDNCHCSLVPVYRRGAPEPDRTLELRDLWLSSTKGRSGKDAINAFRTRYDQTLLQKAS